jgi:hypothetical protein
MLVTCACAAVLGHKLFLLSRDPGNLAQRALSLMLAGLTVSVGIQPIVAWLDRLLVTMLAVMTVIFVLGRPDPYTARGETHSTSGHLSWLPLPYLYLYPCFGYLISTLLAVVRLCVRYGGVAARRYLRASLRTLAAGCVLGLCYASVSLVALTLQEARINVDTWKTATTTPLYLATDATVLAGCAIPSMAAVATRLGQAAGLSESDIKAVREAATLAAAIEAKTAGTPPELAAAVTPPCPAGGTDLSSEVTWLCRVATAYTTSPIVRRTVALLRDRSTT